MARVRTNLGEKVRSAQAVAIPMVTRTLQQTLAGARRLAPRGDHMSGSGRRKRGQPLSPSLRSDMRIGPRDVRGKVGSTVKYAATIHEGSKAHVIRGGGKKLKFRWDQGNAILAVRGNRGAGGFFYFHKVHHPGNRKPVKYLTTPLQISGRANGFRVTTLGASPRNLT